MVSVQCPECDVKLRLSDTAAGKVVACTRCQARIRVPACSFEPPNDGLEERIKPASGAASGRRVSAPVGDDDEDDRRSPRRRRDEDHEDDEVSRVPPSLRKSKGRGRDDDYDDDDDRPARSRRKAPSRRRRSTSMNPFRLFAGMDSLISSFVVLGTLAFITLPVMLLWKYYFFVPVSVACLAIVFANLWFLVLAFRDSPATGILVLLVPFFNVIFLIKNFGETCRPFFLSLVGMAVLGVSLGSALLAAKILPDDTGTPQAANTKASEPPPPPRFDPAIPKDNPVPKFDPPPKLDPPPQPKNDPIPVPQPPIFPKENKRGAIVTEIPGDVFDFLRRAGSENRFAEVDMQGFKIGKDYREFVNDGGVLIGLQVGYGRFGTNPTINAVRAIYTTRNGEAMGNWHGPVPHVPTTLKAKPGYVVAAISIRSALAIDAIALHYAKFENGRLNLKDNDTTDWTGGPGGRQATIGGQGYIFTGIVGKLNREGEPCALGLLAPRE